jgi:hypothetical protein
MGFLKSTHKTGLMIVLVSLFSNAGVSAAESLFDGSFNGMSFSESVLSLKERAESLNGYKLQVAAVPRENTPSRTICSGARIYEFAALYKDLGYSDPGYFEASPDEIEDLETYISKEDTFYKEVNDYLRFYPKPYTWSGIGPDAAKSMVKNIDRVFTRAPSLPGDLILFRGIGLKFRGNKSFKINEEFIEKGYVSTSTSFKVAKYFAVEKDDGEDTDAKKAILAIYNNRSGEKGLLIDQEEDEVILRHGIKFRIMAKKETGEKYDFYLAQACSGPCEASLREDVREFWENLSPQ